MCQIGDIIVIDNYKSHGKVLEHHSFVVIDDSNGKIRGVDYDMIGVVMSSFHNDKHKKKKLSYPGNYPVYPDDQDIVGGNNGKDGFIKAEQFYYFNKEKINYKVIGCLQEDVFNLLMDFISNLTVSIDRLTDNL